MLHENRPYRPHPVSLIPAIALFLCLLSVPALADHEFSSWDLPPQGTYAAPDSAWRNAHAVILFDRHVIDDVSAQGSTIYSRYRRIRLLDTKAVDDNRTIEISFGKKWKILSLAGRTLKRNGEIIGVEEKDIFEKTILGYGHERVRAKAFAFKNVEPGDVVEYRYASRRNAIIPPLVQLRHTDPCLHSDLLWYYYPPPSGDLFGLSAKELDNATYQAAYVVPNGYRFGGQVQELTEKQAHVGFALSIDSLPGLPDEPYMAPRADESVLFLPFYVWPRRNAATPYWERLARDCGEPAREVLSKQKRLESWMQGRTPPERNLRDDLKACCDLIHAEVKNVDELEDNELPVKVPEPDNIDEILKDHFANTYQIDLLLAAMLRRLGYDATIFLARDVTQGYFVPDWQTPDQFTTGGVAVKTSDGGMRFVTPAPSVVTPEALPWEICGTTALLVNLAKEEKVEPFEPLVQIPMAGPEGNGVDLEVRVTPGEAGALSGRLEARWGCRNDPYFLAGLIRQQAKSRKEASKRMKDLLMPRLSWSAEEESLSFSGTTIVYRCSLDVQGAVERAGQQIVCNLGRFRTDDFLLTEGPRQTRIDFHYPRTYRSHVILSLPAGATPVEIPPEMNKAAGVAEFHVRAWADGGKIHQEGSLSIPHSLYKVTAKSDFEEFFRALREATDRPTIVKMEGTP